METGANAALSGAKLTKANLSVPNSLAPDYMYSAVGNLKFSASVCRQTKLGRWSPNLRDSSAHQV